MMNATLKQQLIQKHDTYQSIYEDTDKDWQTAYEVAYFYEYGQLPDDGLMIESVEETAGDYIFIHHDTIRRI